LVGSSKASNWWKSPGLPVNVSESAEICVGLEAGESFSLVTRKPVVLHGEGQRESIRRHPGDGVTHG